VKLFAGIDGGATKTRVVLTTLDGAILAEQVTGPSNYQTVGMDEAVHNLLGGVDAALAQVERPIGAVERVVAGFAGFDTRADLPSLQALMDRAGTHWGADRAWMAVNDAVVAWAGALAAEPGAIVISGTGSIAFAVNAEGCSVRADGWGHWLGDEGSGFDIGRGGVMAALRALDGRGGDTAMVDVLMRHTAAQGVADWQAWVVQITQDGADSHSQIAAFAPHVCRLADAGDAECLQILEQAAENLFRAAWSVVRRSRLNEAGETVPVAIVGSVLTNDPYLRRRFSERLQAECSLCQVVEPLSQPAEGAALLARQPWRLPKDVLSVVSTAGDWGLGIGD